ncbi:DgyrCDS13496 [Dimorphilus gyrociliatus]|uniref:DgyrCDS13496 n=1 Tax=Dimorphilus gyrociliatus TaxID=2664684 RepID=A0A7I8WAT7_9ANNE|nr:DgyrCDS13496 [Dimorphilus gyrociliatus]
MANLNLSPSEVASKVPELRTKFNEKFQSEIASGKFDERDVSRFNSDDAYARCFLRTMKAKGDVDKAVDVVQEAFIMRKEYLVNDFDEDKVPQEIKDRNGIFYRGKDKEGHPILYIDVKQNTASGDEVVLLKCYIAGMFEKHHRTNPEQMCVVFFDMSSAGLSNLNMDITKFIISCFKVAFPAFLAYMINYDMPFILNAAWKVISSLASGDQSKKIQVVKKGDLTRLINKEELWGHLAEKN